jgi:hypothetical protein
MWEQFLLRRGFKNIVRGSQVTGFQFKINLPYYRGIWVSQCFHGFAVRVDGVLYPLDRISVKIGDRLFPWEQVDNAVDVFWHFGDPATIIVEKPGGLPAGLHEVECGIRYERSYSLRPEDDPEGIITTRGTTMAPEQPQGGASRDPMAGLMVCSLDMVLVM